MELWVAGWLWVSRWRLSLRILLDLHPLRFLFPDTFITCYQNESVTTVMIRPPYSESKSYRAQLEHAALYDDKQFCKSDGYLDGNHWTTQISQNYT